MKSNRQFEDIIKNKVDNLEYEFDPAGWEKLKIELPKKPWFSSYLMKIAASVIALGVISSTAFYFYSSNENKNDTISEKLILHNKTTTIELSENTISEQINSTKVEKSSLSTNSQIVSNKSNVSTTKPADKIKESTSNKPVKETELKENTEIKNYYRNPEITAEFYLSETEGCQPLTIWFTPKFQNKDYSYIWQFGNIATSEEMIPAFTFINAGEYFVELSIVDKNKNIVAKLKSEEISVKSNPDVKISWTQDDIYFSFNFESQDIVSQIWEIGQSCFNERSPDYQITKNGNYQVSLIANSANGCKTRIDSTIYFVREHKFEVPNAFTPNADGSNDYFGAIGDKLSDFNFELKIFNQQGQLVFESNDPEIRWDGRILGNNRKAERGIYIWRIITKDSFGNTQKRQGHVSLLNY